MKLDLKGFGYCVPDRIISNDDLSKVMDTSNEWIESRTGIKERRYSNVDTSGLAFDAARKAIIDSKVDPSLIDLVICATFTADGLTPSVACKILDELGIKKAMAFDLNAACSGFIYALNVASSMMKENGFKYALVIGAEVLSKVLDYTDRSTAVIFGDGAGAVLVSAEHNDVTFVCHAKTDIDNLLYCSSVKRNDILFTNSISDDHFVRMNGKEIYKFAIISCESIIKEVLEKANMTIDDIDMVIPHQANLRIIASFTKKVNIPDEKIFINVDKYGNTSAASIAIALTEAKEENIIKKGDNLLLVGFGSGLTWSATIIKY